jgi:hypothetical protein
MPLPKASEMSARQAQEQQAWKDNREKQLSQIRKTLSDQGPIRCPRCAAVRLIPDSRSDLFFGVFFLVDTSSPS